MKHTALVLLKLDWDDEYYDPPSSWNWNIGIELQEDQAKVICIQDEVKEVRVLNQL